MRGLIVSILICVVAMGFALPAGASMPSPFSTSPPGYGWGVAEATATNADGNWVVADGTWVYLTCVCCTKIVVKTRPNYWVVRDVPGTGNPALIIRSPAPPEIELNENLDVCGVLATLPNGYRALVRPVRVFAYLDDNADVIYRGLFRDVLNGPWPNLLQVFPEAVSTQSFRAMDEPSDPDSGGDETPDSAAAPIFCQDVAAIEAAYQANGPVFIEADCMPISNPTDTTFTLLDSDPNSQNSILVYWTASSKPSKQRRNGQYYDCHGSGGLDGDKRLGRSGQRARLDARGNCRGRQCDRAGANGSVRPDRAPRGGKPGHD